MKHNLAWLLLLVGCTTTGREVQYRSEGLDSKPSWALHSADLQETSSKFEMTGEAQMDGSANQTACLRAASQDARARIAKQLQSKIKGLTQSYLTEAGQEFEEAVANSFEATLKDARVSGQYFERVQITLKDREEDRLECFAKITITRTAYKKLLKDIERNANHAGVKAAMHKESERVFEGD